MVIGVAVVVAVVVGVVAVGSLANVVVPGCADLLGGCSWRC